MLQALPNKRYRCYQTNITDVTKQTVQTLPNIHYRRYQTNVTDVTRSTLQMLPDKRYRRYQINFTDVTKHPQALPDLAGLLVQGTTPPTGAGNGNIQEI